MAWPSCPGKVYRSRRRWARCGPARYLILGLFLAAVGAILGARVAAHWPTKSPRLTGLAVGAGLALLVFVVGFARGGLDFWLPPNAAMAVVGGWLGGRVAHYG